MPRPTNLRWARFAFRVTIDEATDCICEDRRVKASTIGKASWGGMLRHNVVDNPTGYLDCAAQRQDEILARVAHHERHTVERVAPDWRGVWHTNYH